jgi:signal peptide peptidase SppA
MRFSDEEIALRIAGEIDVAREQLAGEILAATTAGGNSDGVIAVIPIVGCIAYRADSFDASSGGASAQWIASRIDRALVDSTVKAMLLDVSSPGGSVEGIPELAQKIFKASRVKPVVAIANGMAASAAYWLASQATEFVVMPSGQVGSIGVYMLTEDWSAFLDKEGIKINAISAGDYKLEGAWWDPLSEEAKTHFQAQVDDVYGQFLSAVAQGRGVTVTDVKKKYGQGRMLDPKPALEAGMVDRIETFDQTVNRLAKWKPGMPYGTKGATFELQPARAVDADPSRAGAAQIAADLDWADAGLRIAEGQ